MANRAVIAGSFDPITYGHLDIIIRAAKIFSEVFVAIGTNPDKKYTFSRELRIQMITNAISKLPQKNIFVKEFDGLLAQFAYHYNADVIVRGIRNVSDMEAELVLAKANKELKDIETFFIPASPDFLTVSSSVCKAIVKESGNVIKYTTMEAKYNLEKHYGKTVFMGVVGGIGCGKSYICNDLVKRINRMSQVEDINENVVGIHLNLDKIGHAVLNGTEPFALHVRAQIVEYFGKEILEEDGMTINRKKLGKLVFAPGDTIPLQVLNQIMKKPMEHEAYRFISEQSKNYKNYKKVFLIEGANLESDWLDFVNNNVIQVTAAFDTKMTRVSKRDGLTEDEIKNRIDKQKSASDLGHSISQNMEKHNYGNHVIIDNTESTEESLDEDFRYIWSNIIK